MKTGTCYFPSYGAALRYYRSYVGREYADRRTTLGRAVTRETRAIVDAKLNASEIHIGRPDLKPGEVLAIEDNRYHVTSP